MMRLARRPLGLPDRRGFTMIEILVAVGLLATMTAVIYSAYSITIRAQRETDLLQERYHTARVVLSRMTREISMAFLSKHVNADEERSKTLFDGGRDKLMFTYLGHQRRVKDAREGDQGVVEYFLRSCKGGESGKCLYRREKSIVDADPEKEGTTELLAANVKSLKIEYWDREKEDWKSEWEVTSEDFMLGPDGWQVSEEVTDEDKTFQLPWRVKIHLVLYDKEREEYDFETQTALYLREPLDFTLGGALTSQQQRLGAGGAAGGLIQPGAGQPLNPLPGGAPMPGAGNVRAGGGGGGR